MFGYFPYSIYGIYYKYRIIIPFLQLGTRFSEYLKFKGVTQKRISQLSRVSESLVSRFCSGGAISSDKLQRILQACDDLSLEWLFFGSGEMIRGHRGDVTNNYGKYAGADIVRDKGVVLKNAGGIHVESNEIFRQLLSEKDRIILEKDKVISERDQSIRELIGMLNRK